MWRFYCVTLKMQVREPYAVEIPFAWARGPSWRWWLTTTPTIACYHFLSPLYYYEALKASSTWRFLCHHLKLAGKETEASPPSHMTPTLSPTSAIKDSYPDNCSPNLLLSPSSSSWIKNPLPLIAYWYQILVSQDAWGVLVSCVWSWRPL